MAVIRSELTLFRMSIRLALTAVKTAANANANAAANAAATVAANAAAKSTAERRLGAYLYNTLGNQRPMAGNVYNKTSANTWMPINGSMPRKI